MKTDEAISFVKRAIAANALANGYLVCGDLKGSATEFLDAILGELFPNERDQALAHQHPDIAFLAPEGRSRTIHTKSMRESIVEPMSKSAYSGGWKVGVILGAEQMERAAANVFLKTLEEPPKKTVFFLLTEMPEQVLPTIVSRCQRVDLPMPSGELEGDDRTDVLEILATPVKDGDVYGRVVVGERLAEKLSALKEAAEDEDIPLIRKAFFVTLAGAVRRWMEQDRLPFYRANRNLTAIDEAFVQSCRYMPDDVVLSFLADRFFFPQ